MTKTKKNLFITGASGFVGTNLLEKLNIAEYNHVYSLVRRENDFIKTLSSNNNITFIKADIFEPHAYSRYLSSADIVIHLAAVTGKARREEYFNINREGSKILIEQCKKYKTKQFVFISSIAAKFQNIKYYYYAQSKIEAEELLKSSGLSYIIIRPTIVIGKKSPVLKSFSKLVNAPVVPIFGDGSVKIQPIHVEDLVECILYVINHNFFVNETVELGGSEQVAIENFIRNIHHLSYNNNFRCVHLPIPFLLAALAILEKHFFTFLPFTAGMLASFSNDGIAKNDPRLSENLDIALKGINEMLELSIQPGNVLDRFSNDVEKECRLFTNYLINCEPGRYVQGKYLKGVKMVGFDSADNFFDALLLSTALKNSFFTRLTDVYTSTFYRNALIRKKMLLLLAILECQNSTYVQIDSANEYFPFSLYLKLGYKAFVFFLSLLLSIIVFGPIHAVNYLRLKLINSF